MRAYWTVYLRRFGEWVKAGRTWGRESDGLSLAVTLFAETGADEYRLVRA